MQNMTDILYKLNDIEDAVNATNASLYKVSDVDDDASPNYYGFLDADGNWYILKETVAAGNNTYRYAKGTSDYTTNWTGRVALSYDYYDAVF